MSEHTHNLMQNIASIYHKRLSKLKSPILQSPLGEHNYGVTSVNSALYAQITGEDNFGRIQEQSGMETLVGFQVNITTNSGNITGLPYVIGESSDQLYVQNFSQSWSGGPLHEDLMEALIETRKDCRLFFISVGRKNAQGYSIDKSKIPQPQQHYHITGNELGERFDAKPFT